MIKQYNSFSEIDKHLKILRLQREIDKESLKLGINKAKTRLHPVQMVEAVSQEWKQLVLNFAIKKGLQWLHKLRRKEIFE